MKKLKIFLVLISIFCNIFSMSDVAQNPKANKDLDVVPLRRNSVKKLSEILKDRGLDKKSKERIKQLLGEDILEQSEINRLLDCLLGEQN